MPRLDNIIQTAVFGQYYPNCQTAAFGKYYLNCHVWIILFKLLNCRIWIILSKLSRMDNIQTQQLESLDNIIQNAGVSINIIQTRQFGSLYGIIQTLLFG